MLSNPADREKLLKVIQELDNSMTRVDAERDFQKEAIEEICEELDIEKKYVRRVARIYHKQNYSLVQQEQEEVEQLYETVVNNSNED